MEQKKKGRFQKLLNVLSEFNSKDTDTVLYTIICISIIPATLLFFLYLWAVDNAIIPQQYSQCFAKQVFHLYCPGCGGTRAIRSLLHGELWTAICYHFPAVISVFLFVSYFITQTLQRLSKGKIKGMSFKGWYLYGILALIVINCIIRNILLVAYGIQIL